MTTIINDDSFKLALVSEDLRGDQSKKAFAEVCKEAKKGMMAHDIGDDYRRVYATCTPEGLISRIRSDMMDNYMIAAFVCMERKVAKGLPLIPWAAHNKKEFEGLHGEIACMRALMWGGFDVNAQMEGTGMTALHAMCSLQWGGGAHPRAVEHLIENGANVNIPLDSTGDTPIITLCGHTGWGEDLDKTFRLLFNAGADLQIEAKDGSSAWGLLQSMDEQYPNPMRTDLIAELAE